MNRIVHRVCDTIAADPDVDAMEMFSAVAMMTARMADKMLKGDNQTGAEKAAATSSTSRHPRAGDG